MKITMKNMISIVTAVVLTLSFGLAYAVDDQMPDMNTDPKDTGTELYASFLKHEADIGKGSVAGGVREKAVIRPHDWTDEIQFMNISDTGTELYEAFLKHNSEVAKGEAAGGTRAKEASRADLNPTNDHPKYPW